MVPVVKHIGSPALAGLTLLAFTVPQAHGQGRSVHPQPYWRSS
jgi:hypothetical protein